MNCYSNISDFSFGWFNVKYLGGGAFLGKVIQFIQINWSNISPHPLSEGEIFLAHLPLFFMFNVTPIVT